MSWVKAIIQHAGSKYGPLPEIRGGDYAPAPSDSEPETLDRQLSDRRKNAANPKEYLAQLTKTMCTVPFEDQYGYWCNNMCDTGFEPYVNFSEHPATEAINKKHMLTIKDRKTICSKCKEGVESPYWAKKTCQ